MKVIIASLTAAAMALSGTAAFAQSAAVATDGSFLGIDTDRNGGVSWAEFNLIYTDINEEQFKAADLDGDGALSEDEFDALALQTGSIVRPSDSADQPAEPSDAPAVN